MRAAAPTPIVSGSGTMFVVSGATDVAAALTASASRPANHELHAEALNRLRGFRGVAALRDHLPLAEALDIVERVARNIDRQQGLPTSSAIAVLSTGARHLRRLAEDIRAGRTHDRRSPEAIAFAESVARHEAVPTAAPEVVVPIASLFFADDGPRIVRQTAAPVTTAADRFRLESAAAGEHLRKLSGEARRELGNEAAPGYPGQASGRVSELQAAADSLVDLARSYGYDELGDSLARALPDMDPASALALAAGDAVGALLVAQRRRVDDLARRVGDLAAGRVLGSLVALGYAPLGEGRATPAATAAQQSSATPESTSVTSPASWSEAPSTAPAPSPELEAEPRAQPSPAGWSESEPTALPTPPSVSATTPAEVVHEPDPADVDYIPSNESAAASMTSLDDAMALPPGTDRPTGRDLHALLASSIAGFERMNTPTEATAANMGDTGAVASATHTEAYDIDGDEPVPVEILLYRGRSALGRALELRDEIRRQGGTPPAEQLDELFDLLDLAATA